MQYNLDDNLLKSIQEIAQNYLIRKIVLFGSRARGDHKSTSDKTSLFFHCLNFKIKGIFMQKLMI